MSSVDDQAVSREVKLAADALNAALRRAAQSGLECRVDLDRDLIERWVKVGSGKLMNVGEPAVTVTVCRPL